MIYIDKKEMNKETVFNLLTEYAIQPTQQRMEIALLLLAKPQHLSADQVLMSVNSHENLVSKATVYNTLNLFAEKGLIRQVIVEPSKVFYDSNTETHHHIYNEDTGMLQDINADNIVIKNLPQLPVGIVKSGIDIVIRVKNKS